MLFFLGHYKRLVVEAVDLSETTTCRAVLGLPFLCHIQ